MLSILPAQQFSQILLPHCACVRQIFSSKNSQPDNQCSIWNKVMFQRNKEHHPSFAVGCVVPGCRGELLSLSWLGARYWALCIGAKYSKYQNEVKLYFTAAKGHLLRFPIECPLTNFSLLMLQLVSRMYNTHFITKALTSRILFCIEMLRCRVYNSMIKGYIVWDCQVLRYILCLNSGKPWYTFL